MLDRFRLFILSQGLSVEREASVQGGLLLSVSDGNHIAHCTFYNTGSILIQGSNTGLKSILKAWAGQGDEGAASGWGMFNLDWREWKEDVRWISDYIKSHGEPKTGEEPEEYIVSREMAFHNYMFRQSSFETISEEKLTSLIRHWFDRYCFMGLDVDTLIKDIIKYSRTIDSDDEDISISAMAEAVSFNMCQHCPTKFIKSNNEYICPQVKNDQNVCASEIIDAIYPYTSSKRVLAYTKQNLKKLLGRYSPNDELKWLSLTPESPIEILMGQALEQAGLLNVPQYQAYDENHRYRVDFVIKTMSGPRIAIECDGLQFHARPANYIADRKRDRYLQEHGFYVMRFSSVEIFQELESCIHEIEETFWRLRTGKLSLESKPRNNYFGLGEE